MSFKYPTYVNLTTSSKEQPNKRTPSPPPRKKSLSSPQAPSKSISSKSTHYTSSSSPSESPTPTHVAPPPKLRFVILMKQEPQELSPLQTLPNNLHVSTMDNWPSGPSNLSPPPRVSRPPPGLPNPPPGFEPLPSTQPFTWMLVPKPTNANVVRSIWLFRHKYHADGSLSRYKVQLVANGRTQQVGIDCDDTFSPVVKPATIRTVLSLALSRGWPVHHLDVKNAFLNGDLSETIYMYQPLGFVDSRFPHHVFQL
ncbi:ribonuclease H-like domain-containing protein [Tanacetum coccineum]